MNSISQSQPSSRQFLAWLCAALASIVAPAVAMLLLADATDREAFAFIGAPIIAIGVMGAGMIAAAVAGRLWIGFALALLTGAGLLLFAHVLGISQILHPSSAALAVLVAATSFAARGALFARSALDKGWWIAVFVVGGEAAMLITALALPDALPDWLLVLLPAQWTSSAIQAALTGTGTRAASSALFALAGTAAATLLVAWLWPRRWPYLIMFSAWLGFSALVWYQPGSSMFDADRTIAAR